MTFLKTVVSAGALALAASAASAAVVSIGVVSGDWASVSPDPVYGLNGVGTNEIRWGQPYYSSSDPQSGYQFDGSSGGVVTEGVSFDLGDFTHFNFAVSSDPPGSDAASITGATLHVAFDLTIDGNVYSYASDYDFTHWETINTANPCANGGANGSGVNVNGCADRVQILNNEGSSDAVVVNGVKYYFDLTGFEGLIMENGLPTFWTVEGQTNVATLYAAMRTEPVSDVPLPATALMMLAGLGGLGLVRRKTRA